MEFPDVIPAGAIIRINQRNNIPIGSDKRIIDTAVGLEYRLMRDVQMHDGISTDHHMSDVTYDPNGWNSETVFHSIDLRYDEIIGGIAYDKNKDAIHLLSKEW